jgi:hypothetical protein
VSTSRQWLTLAAAAALGAWAGYQLGKPPTCDTLRFRAAVSQKAAELCTGELVGCSLGFEQVERVLADQEAAKVCK